MDKESEFLLKKGFLEDCPPDNAFWLKTGHIIRNIYELADSIEHMNDEVFNYHVNKKHKRNDFAVWIKDIIGDEKLSNNLRKITKKKKYLRILRERIHEIEFQGKKYMNREDRLIIIFGIFSLLIILFSSLNDPVFSSRFAIILIILFLFYKLLKN